MLVLKCSPLTLNIYKGILASEIIQTGICSIWLANMMVLSKFTIFFQNGGHIARILTLSDFHEI